MVNKSIDKPQVNQLGVKCVFSIKSIEKGSYKIGICALLTDKESDSRRRK